MGMAALVIAGTADLFAGLLLTQMEDYLLLIPGMMVMIYSAIGMRGNIFGAMGSRIGTAMNIGTFEMSFRRGTVLRANVESAISLTLCMSVAMGIAAWAVAVAFFGARTSVWGFIFISTLGGFLAGLIVMMFNVLIAWEGFRREWDVDNITAPLIAAIGDIVTMPMIFLATWLFVQIDAWSFGELFILIASIVMIAATVIYTVIVIRRRGNKRDFSGEARRITVQSLPVLILCLFFEIGAGITIQDVQDSLIAYSVLMIMMPAFLNQGNALSGMLTSRLASNIHLGTLEPTWAPQHLARENFLIMYVCAMITFAYIGTVSYLATIMTGDANTSYGISLAIILLAGFIATTILNLLSYYVAIATTKFGLDPDDHSIPITSSVMDLVGSMVLVSVIAIFI